MGVEWTYVLLCIMGTANFFSVANPAPESVAGVRESRAIDNLARDEFEAEKSAVQASFRNKRDVSSIMDHNGNQVISARSSGDNGHSFSYSGTTGTGAASASSSSSSSSSSGNGGSGFGFATSRIGGGAPSNSFSGSSNNVGNAWPGQGSTGIPGGSSWAGGNQNHYANAGYNPYYPNQYSGFYGGYPNQQLGSYGRFPNQYSGAPGGYGFNVEDFLQQQFRTIQAQHQALQAQFQQSQPGSYSWARAGAYATSSNGGIDPNTRVSSYSTTLAPTRSTGEFKRRRDHSRQRNVGVNLGYENQNRFNSYGFNNGGGFSSGFDGNGGWNPGVSRGGFDQQGFNFPRDSNSAVASSSLGPGGGFQYAEINPAAPGIVSRIAETHPPASGNNVQIFSSSSSSSFRHPDGKISNKKTATSGINDNGKVTVYTVKDP